MKFQLESMACTVIGFKWSLVLRQMCARLNYSHKSLYWRFVRNRTVKMKTPPQ